MIKLGLRLKKIFDEVCGKSLCDVGCDHGKLAVYAKLNGFEKVIATDISEPSLEKAKRLANEYGIEIKTLLCDGLKKVASDAVETVVIAGMGGLMVEKIIDDSLKDNKHFKHFVLSPNTDDSHLRRYLIENGFGIKSDYTLIDGKKFYTILTAGDYPINKPSPLEIEFGINCLSCTTTKLKMEKEFNLLNNVKGHLGEEKTRRFRLLSEVFDEHKTT